jgi:hypothetical protein
MMPIASATARQFPNLAYNALIASIADHLILGVLAAFRIAEVIPYHFLILAPCYNCYMASQGKR